MVTANRIKARIATGLRRSFRPVLMGGALIAALGIMSAAPASANGRDRDDRPGWNRRSEHEHDRRGRGHGYSYSHHWRGPDRRVVVIQRPVYYPSYYYPYYGQPPVVVYRAPRPTYSHPSGVNFIFPLTFR